MNRRTLMIVAALVPCALAVPADAKTRRRVKPAKVTRVETPLGLQGAAGAGIGVAIPFTLKDQSFRNCDVQMQYGIDRNADGGVAEEEFRDATENRLDSRNTRNNRAPQLYRSAADQGAAHAIVWRSDIDLGNSRVVPGPHYALDAQGRFVPQEFDPSSPVVAFVDPGVIIRLRAVSVTGQKGPWLSSGAISVSGNHAPVMTIDSLTPGAVILAGWTVADADSEDLNGNGVLDLLDGEDLNGNLALDAGRVGVAFDWHRIAPGEVPASMTDDQLSALKWFACTRKAGVGDGDSLVLTPGQPPEGGLAVAAPGAGLSYVFAWDVAADAGAAVDNYILRATVFDTEGEHGVTSYPRTIVRSSAD